MPYSVSRMFASKRKWRRNHPGPSWKSKNVPSEAYVLAKVKQIGARPWEIKE